MAGKGDKGFALEDSLRSYFWEAGYFAIRGIQLRIAGVDITDIDLWLYERPAAAARRRMIVDIKNKKRSKAAERIIWARGLADILQIDNAIVASKDSKSESEQIAKRASVIFLGSEALRRIESSPRTRNIFHLSEDALLDEIRVLDKSRRSVQWMDAFSSLKSSLIDGLGVTSVNRALSRFAFFAAQATEASPASTAAVLGTRLSHYAASLVLLSLDYVLADLNFATPESRSEALINGIRYGELDGMQGLLSLRLGLGLVRSYAPGGQGEANEIERRFRMDAENIRAEIVAELVKKLTIGKIFSTARELQQSSYSQRPHSSDLLTLEARATIGALLDFSEIDRKRFSEAAPATSAELGRSNQSSAEEPNQPSLSLDPPDKLVE